MKSYFSCIAYTLMVNKIHTINSHQAESSYPAFFKLVWLTSASKYT